jgi:ribosome-associated protein
MASLQNRNFSDEFIFTASRGSGPGGQNVNKVSSKVELRFHVANSALLSDEEKAIIIGKLANKINQEGFLQIIAQAERSQLQNKGAAVKRFYHLMQSALHQPKARKATKPSPAAVRERLQSKRKASQKKASRQGKDLGPD